MRAPTNTSAVGAFAIWGSTDLPGLGDQALCRVTEQQLTARLPGWTACRFAPLGWTRPIAADGGWVAAPLAGRADPAASPVDVATSPTDAAGPPDSTGPAVMCPSFPVGGPLSELVRRYGDERVAEAAGYFAGERGSPVLAGVRVAEQPVDSLVEAANRRPYVAVRDPDSRDRLRSAGVRGEVAVVPHPGLLAGELVSDDVLRTRRQALRQLGLLPEDYLVLQVTDAVMTRADGLAGLGRDLLPGTAAEDVVLLPTDSVRLDDLPDLDGRALPAELVLDDRLAVLAGATVVIATDEHGAAVAAGLGRPWVLIDLTGADRRVAMEFGYARQIVDTAAKTPAAIRAAAKLAPYKEKALAAVTTHFDRLAGEITASVGHSVQYGRSLDELAAENAALRAGHDRLRQRMFVERQRLVERVVELDRGRSTAERDAAEARAELAAARAELTRLAEHGEVLTAQVAELDRELLAWRDTKLVRWTDSMRRAYGKMLRQ